ncbi:MAG: polysaccharide deacetylase family protein [Clostridiales bacterium]|jgi:peptidoglycan/xylan/chitin deacetylase (PgdA/CDA1 family)|nr:polysaccharide deacetylase family protein [Clostridiales bacterium]
MLIFSLSIIVLIGCSYSIIPTLAYKWHNKLKRKSFKDKSIYLTFDDGPDEKYTGQLLDLLQHYKITATFFVVGEFAYKNPELITRMQQEGHTIGLHSLKHQNALWQTPKATYNDLQESLKVMEKLGVEVKLFRPPWGHLNWALLRGLKQYGLKLALWDVMTQDWSGYTRAQDIADKLIYRVKTGSVICLHDGRGKNEAPRRTIAALEQVIPIWLLEGYTFRKMDEYDE